MENSIIGKSMYDIHMECVRELLSNGEKVLYIKGRHHGSIWGYVKAEDPHKHAGSIFRNKDGTFEILCDHLQYGVTGLKLEEIGLCDSSCWYEWMDNNRQMEEVKVKEKFRMPEHFRCKLRCKDCEAGTDMDGHYSLSCIDAYVSGHIEAFGHTKYELEIYSLDIKVLKNGSYTMDDMLNISCNNCDKMFSIKDSGFVRGDRIPCTLCGKVGTYVPHLEPFISDGFLENK